jgi:hypothetical protein
MFQNPLSFLFFVSLPSGVYLDHNSKMLSNLNHDHGRKQIFETWKEKIEKKKRRFEKKSQI